MPARAALAMWWDMAPGHRSEFEHWHSHEHFPERLRLPGFLRASRWADAGGGEGFFVLYELEAYEALVSPEYLARLNDPTPWSRVQMPRHRGMVRSPCHVLAGAGAVVAAHAVTVRFAPVPGQEARLREHLEAGVRAWPQQPGLAGAHLLRTEPPAIAPTTEQRIRGMADRAADWIVLVAGYEAQAVAGLARAALDGGTLQRHGAAAGALVRTHVLRLAMEPADLRP